LAFEEDFDIQQRIDDIDKTYPKYHGMHRAAGEFMAEWNRAIEEDSRAVESLKSATKRAVVQVNPGESDTDNVARRRGSCGYQRMLGGRNYGQSEF